MESADRGANPPFVLVAQVRFVTTKRPEKNPASNWEQVSKEKHKSISFQWFLPPRPAVFSVDAVFGFPWCVTLCPWQVDSAMSLIQAAKNLMNAVVQTVKASYVASTKYQKSQGMASLNLPAVSWKMKAPEKKPLVKREKQDETQTKIKRASQKKHVNPVQALSEFKAMESI